MYLLLRIPTCQSNICVIQGLHLLRTEVCFPQEVGRYLYKIIKRIAYCDLVVGSVFENKIGQRKYRIGLSIDIDFV